MNPAFQEGRRPRANAVASLAHTGHVSPLGRRPGLGFAAHGQHPTTASRPRALAAVGPTGGGLDGRIRRKIA